LKKKRKEKGQQNNEAALDRLEEDLRREAERLDLPLEQKTKAMKQRERKVSEEKYMTESHICLCKTVVEVTGMF